MSQFQKGDVVQLKSGGTLMTVDKVGMFMGVDGDEERVVCVWMLDDGTPKSLGFAPHVLQVHEV